MSPIAASQQRFRPPSAFLQAGERLGEDADLPAQRVDLVEEEEDDRQRLLVEREVAAQLDDEPGAGEVDLLEALLLGEDEALLDPALELGRLDAAAAEELVP